MKQRVAAGRAALAAEAADLVASERAAAAAEIVALEAELAGMAEGAAACTTLEAELAGMAEGAAACTTLTACAEEPALLATLEARTPRGVRPHAHDFFDQDGETDARSTSSAPGSGSVLSAHIESATARALAPSLPVVERYSWCHLLLPGVRSDFLSLHTGERELFDPYGGPLKALANLAPSVRGLGARVQMEYGALDVSICIERDEVVLWHRALEGHGNALFLPNGGRIRFVAGPVGYATVGAGATVGDARPPDAGRQ